MSAAVRAMFEDDAASRRVAERAGTDPAAALGAYRDRLAALDCALNCAEERGDAAAWDRLAARAQRVTRAAATLRVEVLAGSPAGAR